MRSSADIGSSRIDASGCMRSEIRSSAFGSLRVPISLTMYSTHSITAATTWSRNSSSTPPVAKRSDQCRSLASSARGSPMRVAIMRSGIGVAMSVTKSHRPSSITPSINSVTVARRKSSWAATRFGVKPNETSRRRRVWSGGSALIIDGTADSGREPFTEQKVAWSASMRWISAWRVIAHSPVSSSQ